MPNISILNIVDWVIKIQKPRSAATFTSNFNYIYVIIVYPKMRMKIIIWKL